MKNQIERIAYDMITQGPNSLCFGKKKIDHNKDIEKEISEKLQTFSGGKTMADNQRTQWEYKTLETWSGDKEIESKLEQLGQNGWEHSGQITSGQGATNKLLFKRPKQSVPEYGYSR